MPPTTEEIREYFGPIMPIITPADMRAMLIDWRDACQTAADTFDAMVEALESEPEYEPLSVSGGVT